MNRPGDQLLACPALSLDENGRFRFCNLRNEPQNLAHLRAFGNDVGHIEPLLQEALKAPVLLLGLSGGALLSIGLGVCLLGLIFGIAIGPCTFAYMAPVLAVTLKVSSTNALFGGLLLAFYGLGHCGVIVAAGTFSEAVQRYLHWNEKSHGALILKRICGVLVLVGGVYLIYSA